ncbi:AI-2E family transporter [Actinocorallia populi]|uniref:AI-2E family transporter n=1 Tax=Actinocorallia populi TaxID=2079200 RepID=UPI000D0891EC|nr:AI-2E family transporter [Actinocorallia populi]
MIGFVDFGGDVRNRALRAGYLLLLVVLVSLAVWAFWRVRNVAIPVLLAVFISSMTVPPARWLVRRGLHAALATTLVWLGVLAGGALTVVALVPITAAGIDDLRLNVDRFAVDVQEAAARFGVSETRLTELTEQAGDWLSRQRGDIADGAITGVIMTGEILVGAVLALVLAVYFTHGGSKLLTWLTGLAPEDSREGLRSSGSVVFQVIGRYMRGVAFVGLVEGALMGLGLWLLGVPLAIPLAVLTWIGAFFPIVGAFLAGLLAAIVAFAAKGWLIALVVVVLAVAVQQIEGNILAPQVYGRALDLPSPVVLVAIALGAALAGIAGAFFATPLTAAAAALLHHHRSTGLPDEGEGEDPSPGTNGGSTAPASLRKPTADVSRDPDRDPPG